VIADCIDIVDNDVVVGMRIVVGGVTCAVFVVGTVGCAITGIGCGGCVDTHYGEVRVGVVRVGGGVVVAMSVLILFIW